MGKNRDRISIVAAILETANSGSSKTRIMFNANLSFLLLEKYLDVAANAGFLQSEGTKYKITDYGRGFLKQYNGFKERDVKAQMMLEDLGYERDG